MANELKWNRFVNNKGHPDTNVELDRELEHRNKFVKEDLKAFNGKVTNQAIERCSHTYNIMQEIISNFDLSTEIKKPSGNHTRPDWESDVRELAKQFVEEELFAKKIGRSHKAFPSVPPSFLEILDLKEIKN